MGLGDARAARLQTYDRRGKGQVGRKDEPASASAGPSVFGDVVGWGSMRDAKGSRMGFAER